MEEQQIGSYKVLRKIGAGGMARVFLAVHKDVPNLKVVLKILDDPRMVERFKQEADKLALLDGNSHVCQIKHFFNHGDDIVIAMEYIDGVTLDQKIEENDRLPIADTLKIMTDVLDTLDFAHQKGIFHRDIKPSNVMMDTLGNIKIIDFGIAKAKTDPSLTTVGSACGTPAYMAPEQFAPTEDINYSTVDIYAVGSTLYQMLTGQCPFESDNVFALRDAKLFGEPRRPRELNQEISKPLEDLILKSLKRNPKERFQSAREMKEALTAVRKNYDTAAVEKTATIERKEEPSPKSKLPILIGVGIVILAAVIFGIVKLMPSGNEPSKSATTSDTLNQAQTAVSKLPVENPVQNIPATGEIIASVRPYGDIYLDNALQGGKTTSLTFSADTGKHILRIENSEAVNKIISDTITVMAGAPVRKSYNFNMPKPVQVIPSTAQPAEKMAVLIIGSNPAGGDVYIDGLQQKRQTPNTFKVKPGSHNVKVSINLDGREITKEQNLSVLADSTVKAMFDFEN